MTLPERFERHLATLELPAGVWLLAVSGGPDSLALLYLLAQTRLPRGVSLEVAHAEHGIHPDSRAVAAQVEARAAALGLPCHVGRLSLGPGTSETAAREARYAWFRRLLGERAAVALLTAHHQDDQVETILMRLLRGSGPAGLAGIPARRGRIVRPLLPFRRAELGDWLREAHVAAWDDPENRNPRHLRTWIRHDLLPLLEARVPDVRDRLVQTGRQAARDREAWDRSLALWSGLDLQEEPGAVSVAAAPLSGYDSAVVRALLAALGRRLGLVIGPERAERIQGLLARGRRGAVAELGAGGAAELAFDRLRLFRGVGHPWVGGLLGGSEGRIAAGEWLLRWREEAAPEGIPRGGAVTWLVPASWRVRPWAPGDRIRPLGGTGSRLVVRCLQDARIARSRRAAWPVVEAEGNIVWVPGVCRGAAQLPAPGARALRVDAELR